MKTYFGSDGLVHGVFERIDKKPWGTFNYHLVCTGECLYTLLPSEGGVITCLTCTISPQTDP